MEDLQDKARLFPLQRQVKSVTSRLFETYLACPTKCFLRSIGEVAANNDFAIWNETRREAYRLRRRPEANDRPPFGVGSRTSRTGHWKNVQWHFALNLVVRAENLEANLQVVQRSPAARKEQVIPVRSDPFCPREQTFAFRQTDGWFRRVRTLEGVGRKGRHGENHPRGQVRLSSR